MGRTSSITTWSLMRVVSRTPAVGEKGDFVRVYSVLRVF